MLASCQRDISYVIRNLIHPPLSNPTAVDKRIVGSWCLYDFANSAFTTLVVTFIYGTFFTKFIAVNENVGTTQWSQAVSLTAILVALLSPILGAIADRGGYRKRFLFIATSVCIAATFALYLPGKGDILLALAIFVIANLAYEMSGVFYNAFLPDIAPHSSIGKISGYGWALGYFGGLICMILALFLFVQDGSLFQLDRASGANIRMTNILVAVWFLIFAIPLFLFVPTSKPTHPDAANPVTSAFKQLKETFGELKRYRQIFRLLIARLVYNDGLVTIFAFGGIYAAGEFGFTTSEVLYFGIALNITAMIGSFLFGFADDRVGGKITIIVSLIGLMLATGLAVFTTSKTVFWISGLLLGIFVGPNQSASRSLMGRFVPDDKENEFFGFFAFSGKATAFLGPFLLGQLTRIYDSQRAGIAVVFGFFLLGLFLIMSVNEREGILSADRINKE